MFKSLKHFLWRRSAKSSSTWQSHYQRYNRKLAIITECKQSSSNRISELRHKHLVRRDVIRFSVVTECDYIRFYCHYWNSPEYIADDPSMRHPLRATASPWQPVVIDSSVFALYSTYTPGDIFWAMWTCSFRLLIHHLLKSYNTQKEGAVLYTRFPYTLYISSSSSIIGCCLLFALFFSPRWIRHCVRPTFSGRARTNPSSGVVWYVGLSTRRGPFCDVAAGR